MSYNDMLLNVIVVYLIVACRSSDAWSWPWSDPVEDVAADDVNTEPTPVLDNEHETDVIDDYFDDPAYRFFEEVEPTTTRRPDEDVANVNRPLSEIPTNELIERLERQQATFWILNEISRQLGLTSSPNVTLTVDELPEPLRRKALELERREVQQDAGHVNPTGSKLLSQAVIVTPGQFTRDSARPSSSRQVSSRAIQPGRHRHTRPVHARFSHGVIVTPGQFMRDLARPSIQPGCHCHARSVHMRFSQAVIARSVEVRFSQAVIVTPGRTIQLCRHRLVSSCLM